MTDPTPTPENVPQEVLDEAMMPELSEDFFEFEGLKVQMKPLKVKYQKQFAKAFAPIIDSIAYDLAQDKQVMFVDENGKSQYRNKGFGDLCLNDWVLLSKAMLDQSEILPRLIQILCHDDGQMITDEQVDESRMQSRDMQAIVLQFCKKSDGIEKQIADFFEFALPAVEGEISKGLEVARAALTLHVKMASENTAS